MRFDFNSVLSGRLTRATLILLISIFCLVLYGGCIYYNTFYNARKEFNRAESARKKSKTKSGRAGAAQYKMAIEKSLKVVENYPNSKWYDDALYILGISYYFTGQFGRSERRLRELLANYPESQYVKQSYLYLAKAKLNQNDIDEAMILFDTVFAGDYEREFRAEAAMAIGVYHLENKNYSSADQYLLAVRDSLGSDEEAKLAQKYMADRYYDTYRFDDALSGYLQLLSMDPDTKERFHSLFRAADCSFRLQRINIGMEYLDRLKQDELYYDSIPLLKLTEAQGFEYDDDLELAVAAYEELTGDESNRKVVAQAYHRLGLIYQYDYDKLTEAKEYYDQAVKFASSSDIGRDALQRSSDIGKVEAFGRLIEIDSTTTQHQIDEAALIQYQLAELYWFNLNKPDTAILEMQYLVDSFPTAFETPKAMIALAQMYREFKGDSAGADSIMREMLDRYPTSDYIPEALEQLHLIGSAADSGYALVYMHRAEELLDEELIDSARANYQLIIDEFPDSKYYLQARFALIWLTETYESPGDSSLILAYSEFIDSFPGTNWADEARKRISFTPVRPLRDASLDSVQQVEDTVSEQVTTDELSSDTASSQFDSFSSLYIDPEGDSIINLPSVVTLLETREEFVYPMEAFLAEWIQRDIYFQIKLDFDGRVADFMLKTPTQYDELNLRLERSVKSMIFDVTLLELYLRDKWFVYKYTVVKPSHLR